MAFVGFIFLTARLLKFIFLFMECICKWSFSILAAAYCLLAAPDANARDAENFKAAVEDKLSFAPAGSVQLSGAIEKALRTSYNGDIMEWNIDDLVRPFSERKEDGSWQIEFWGKWFTSAALAYDYNPCALLDSRLKYAVKNLLATQSPDGQITTYKSGREFGTWDMWGRKYVMLGLLAEYDRTGDKTVLAAIEKHAGYIMENYGKAKKSICDNGMWGGLAASSILEPFVKLYRATADKKYLDFCLYIVEDWSQSKNKPDLLKKALAGKNVFDMFEKPSDDKSKGYMSGGYSKSYEMMSCYEGLMELYRATGNANYKKAVENVARNIRDTEITVLGSGSIWERWVFGKFCQQRKTDHWMETCVTATWIKLCAQMLRISGDSRFADDIELAAYNALIPAQMNDGKWWAHYTPMDGIRTPAPEQCKIHMNCCVASGPRGLFMLPKIAYMTSPNSITVNFYERSSARLPLNGGEVRLELTGGDMREGNVAGIFLKDVPPGDSEFEIALRIPRWSKTSRVFINGVEVPEKVEAGTYLKLSRKWKKNDAIAAVFDCSVKLIQDPADSRMYALSQGPFVFAADKRFEKDFDKPATFKTDENGNVIAKPAEASGANLAIDVETAGGGTRTFIDYCSAGSTWSKDSQFRVWTQDPTK